MDQGRDKPVISLQYVYISVQAEFTPTKFWVMFVGLTSWKLTIEGRNLRPLYDRLQDHYLRRIRKVDRDFLDDGKPVVTKLDVQDVTPNEREWPTLYCSRKLESAQAASCVAQTTASSVMTLVVAMATADSVVIAADRRVRIKKGVFNDTVVKLVKLSATTLGSATGSVRLLGHGSDVIRFDVYELMRHFFADQQFSGEKLVAFEEHLKATFAQYCNTYRPSEFVDVSFQLVIYTRWNADFMLHQRQCKTIDSGALGINRANTICKHSGVNPFGDVDVINEITGGNNPAFADLRSDPEVKRFVIGRLGCAIGSVSKDEALAFCPKLITLCNERYPLLGKGESPIGPTYNLGTIMAEGCEIH